MSDFILFYFFFIFKIFPVLFVFQRLPEHLYLITAAFEIELSSICLEIQLKFPPRTKINKRLTPNFCPCVLYLGPNPESCAIWSQHSDTALDSDEKHDSNIIFI